MKVHQIGKIISVTVAVLVVAFVFLYEAKQSSAPVIDETVVQEETVSLSVEGLYTDKIITISAGDTVLTVLEDLNVSEPELRLVSKDYAGLGTLVESLHGYTNGMDDKYWQYQVNDVTPLIGADKYELNDGDRVSWSFSLSEF